MHFPSFPFPAWITGAADKAWMNENQIITF
jgi:hypothetical protein